MQQLNARQTKLLELYNKLILIYNKPNALEKEALRDLTEEKIISAISHMILDDYLQKNPAIKLKIDEFLSNSSFKAYIKYLDSNNVSLIKDINESLKSEIFSYKIKSLDQNDKFVKHIKKSYDSEFFEINNDLIKLCQALINKDIKLLKEIKQNLSRIKNDCEGKIILLVGAVLALAALTPIGLVSGSSALPVLGTFWGPLIFGFCVVLAMCAYEHYKTKKLLTGIENHINELKNPKSPGENSMFHDGHLPDYEELEYDSPPGYS